MGVRAATRPGRPEATSSRASRPGGGQLSLLSAQQAPLLGCVGIAAPAFAAIGIGRKRIAAAGVITASYVITAWRTLSTPGRRP